MEEKVCPKCDGIAHVWEEDGIVHWVCSDRECGHAFWFLAEEHDNDSTQNDCD